MKKIIASLLLATALTACTDADKAAWHSLGDEATITCFSGGQVVYKGVSTGAVNDGEGQGISFMDAKTHRYVNTFADCIVESGG